MHAPTAMLLPLLFTITSQYTQKYQCINIMKFSKQSISMTMSTHLTAILVGLPVVDHVGELM